MTLKDLVYKASWHWPFRNRVEARLQRRLFDQAREVYSASQDRFPEAIALPPKFGKGLSERAVELVLARLAYDPGMEVLDVGHANAQVCHRRMVADIPDPKHITGIDIGKPIYDISSLYENSYVASVTETPFPDATFDLIWCISALEHFGMDNTAYAEDAKIVPEDAMDRKAISEMIRILKSGGTLLITVPFGRYEDHGWARNYDAGHWQELLDTARPHTSIKELYFKYDNHGWLSCEPGALRDASYFSRRNYGAAGIAVCLITKG